MKKLVSVLIVIALFVCSASTVISSEKASPAKVLSEGVAQDMYLSTAKNINLEFSPDRKQIFEIKDSNTLVWSNMPSEETYTRLVLYIYPELQAMVASNSIHTVVYNRTDKNKSTFEIPLPTIENGVYQLVLRASSAPNTVPVDRYQMLIAVVNGKYYFAERPITSGSNLAEKLEKAAADYLSDKEYMGISIGIVKDGEVLFLNYGYSDENGEKITEHLVS